MFSIFDCFACIPIHATCARKVEIPTKNYMLALFMNLEGYFLVVQEVRGWHLEV